MPLDVDFLYLVGSNILLLMVVQQRVAILEFSQEKMSTCLSILPSWLPLVLLLKLKQNSAS